MGKHVLGQLELGGWGESLARHNPKAASALALVSDFLAPQLAPFLNGAAGYARGGPVGGLTSALASFGANALAPTSAAPAAGATSRAGDEIIATAPRSTSLDSTIANIPSIAKVASGAATAPTLGGLGSAAAQATPDLVVTAPRSTSPEGTIPNIGAPLTSQTQPQQQTAPNQNGISDLLSAFGPKPGLPAAPTPGPGGIVRSGAGPGAGAAAGLPNAGALRPQIYPWTSGGSSSGGPQSSTSNPNVRVA